MPEARESKSSKENLVKKVLGRYQGKNKTIVKSLLERVTPGDSVFISLDDNTNIAGQVLNLFYPQGDFVYQSGEIHDSSGKLVKKQTHPFGVKIAEAQAEEVAHYSRIKSYRIL